MKKILVTGAYGYIGSHTVKKLAEYGYVVDSLDITPSTNDITRYVRKNIIGDIRNPTNWGNYDAVIHLAGLLDVAASVITPWDYVNSNVIGTKNVLKNAPSDNFIFASTAAAFDPTSSPYAQTKLLCESVIREHVKENKTNFTIFRFFNIAGNNGDFSQIGKATHIVRVAAETAAGIRPHMYLYGTDYDTRDGTCIRDFIHVLDLVSGIVKAVENPKNTKYECLASGYGTTCREVIDMMKKVSKVDFKVIETDRREGDPVSSLIPEDEIKSDFVDCRMSLDDMCLSAYITEIFNRKNLGGVG
jgi:UDP-glucose 4-epimerase